MLQFAKHLEQPLPSDPALQAPRGNILKVMRFVDHQSLKRGEDGGRVLAGLLAESQISHQQRMVDNKDISTGGISAG